MLLFSAGAWAISAMTFKLFLVSFWFISDWFYPLQSLEYIVKMSLGEIYSEPCINY